ncbi:MAG: glutathione S-transferase family protein [Verrucomicrobiota bacterium]
MPLTIYQLPHSPYCIPITRALEALGVEFEVLNVTPHTREEVIQRSEGKFYFVPMLDHNGKLVMESSTESIDIARYVDENFASGRLFPAEIEAAHLPLVEKIENELEMAGFVLMDPFYLDSIEDIVARTMIIRHKERKFGPGCVERWREQHDELFARFLTLLAPAERTLAEQPFLFGITPVYADFALFGILENVTWGGTNALPESLSNILRWREATKTFRYQ